MPVVTKYAATGQAAGGAFNGAWTNPANVASDDGVYATAAPGKNQEFASVFPIAFATGEVPSGATINSALVEIQVKCSTTSSIGIVTSTLFADSGQATAIGAVPGVQTPATEPTVDTTYSFTRNPTESQVRDLWVRVQGTRGNSNTALTWSLDFVRVTVDYTEPPPATTGSGSSTLAALQSMGTGAQAFSASGASSLAVMASTGSGEVTAAGISGTAASDLQALTSTGSGTVGVPAITGTAASTFAALLSQGTAAEAFSGTADSSLTSLTSTGSGTALLPISGSAVSSLLAISSTGSGTVEGAAPPAITGTGASVLQALRSTGTGTNTNQEEGPWISHGTIHIARPPINH